MDMALLKMLIPLGIVAITAIIGYAKLQAKSQQHSEAISMLAKDVQNLEKQSSHTVTLVAKMDQAERNVTQLWTAHESVNQKLEASERNITSKLERHRDRLDERFIALREKINGGSH
tara:strand:+ start:3868 stop:4218 length:351 start_codon:yes stop_codon:yes gene_type:complete